MPIRQARAADLPTIVAIYNSTVAGRQVTADLHPVSVDERQTCLMPTKSHTAR